MPRLSGYSFILFFLLTLQFSTAAAALFEQISIDPRAMSLGNSVTADPPGIMSIHYNPAGLSRIEHDGMYTIGVSATDVSFDGTYTANPDMGAFVGGFTAEEAEGEGGTSGISTIPLTDTYLSIMLSPQYGMSYRKPGSKWTFAIGGYEPFSLGWKQEGSDNPGVFSGKEVVHSHYIYAAPSFSYRMIPSLSFGLSVGFGTSFHKNQFSIRMPSDATALTRVLGTATAGVEIPILSTATLPTPFFGGGIEPYASMGDLDIELEDKFSPSFNIGTLWEPSRRFSIGLVYQSEIKSKLKGDYTMKYSTDMASMMAWFGYGTMLPATAATLGLPTSGEDQAGSCKIEKTFPQRVQLGIRIKPIQRLKCLVDLHWAEWSSTRHDKYEFDQELSLLKYARVYGYSEQVNTFIFSRNLKDTIHWSLGFEYAMLSWLDLRMGYEKRPTSVKKDYFDLMYPITDMDNYCIGAGIRLKNDIRIDFGISYMDGGTFSLKNDQSRNFNRADYTRPIYSPHTGLDYTQKTRIITCSTKVGIPFN